MSTEMPSQKKKGGCAKAFGIGCVTVIVLLAAGSFLAYRGGKQFLKKISDQYTATAPAQLPTVEASDQEASALRQRVDEFSKALKEGRPAPELTLTARDINVLIQKNPSWSSSGGNVYVTIENDRIHGEASIPLEKLGGFLKGRWLNGSGTFRVETAAGRLLVFMDALSVRGQPVPEQFMAGIRSKNLAEEATKKPEDAALLQKLDSVTVRDGKLCIKAK